MYDIAIIGGGPGGYAAAEKAGKNGLQTILFEKKDLGGVCLNEGCIPTKTLLYSAKLYDNARKSEKYGVRVEGAELDYKKMTDRKTKVIRKLVAGVGLRMKNAGVEVVKAEAIIEGRTAEGAIRITAGDTTYEAKNLLICTGSETFIPPIEGLDISTNEAIVTNRELLALKEAPTSLTVIGGGVIGMEFASLFNSLGSPCKFWYSFTKPYNMRSELPSVGSLIPNIYILISYMIIGVPVCFLTAGFGNLSVQVNYI